MCKTAKFQKRPSKDYKCNKNWDSSSSSMESDILAQGVKWLAEGHIVLYTKIIGDGVFSSMKNIREKVAFSSRHIPKKCEWANHVVRNLRKNLYVDSENSKAFPGKTGLIGRKISKKWRQLQQRSPGDNASHLNNNG